MWQSASPVSIDRRCNQIEWRLKALLKHALLELNDHFLAQHICVYYRPSMYIRGHQCSRYFSPGYGWECCKESQAKSWFCSDLAHEVKQARCHALMSAWGAACLQIIQPSFARVLLHSGHTGQLVSCFVQLPISTHASMYNVQPHVLAAA